MRICACTETSSAEVGSSQTRNSGWLASARAIEIRWPDAPEPSRYSADFLASLAGHAPPAQTPAPGMARRLWSAQKPLEPRPPLSHDDVVGSDEGLRACLERIQVFGFAVVEGAPRDELLDWLRIHLPLRPEPLEVIAEQILEQLSPSAGDTGREDRKATIHRVKSAWLQALSSIFSIAPPACVVCCPHFTEALVAYLCALRRSLASSIFTLDQLRAYSK